jgi:hypothetical protein
MKEHKWRIVLTIPDRHLVQWCEKCGTVKHQRIQHSIETCEPRSIFHIPGKSATPNSQECIE